MKRLLPLLALLLAPLASACGDPSGSDPKLSSLSISPDVYYLGVGDTVRLIATGTTAGGDDASPKPRFQTLQPQIASVTGDGLVTALALGTARIVGRSGGRSDTTEVHVVGGGIRSFNVNGVVTCETPQFAPARPVATTAHAVFMEDTRNPAGGFTPAEYQELASEFETQVYPTDVANFGTPTDIDHNGKVVVLFTRAVNELTPAGAPYVVGGFYFARDLFPRKEQSDLVGCTGSNQAEMFYMLAPDPTGSIHNNARSAEYVRRNTLGTLAHELQHLINASRRLYVNNADSLEAVWLDEGLSHVAEELAMYRYTGLTPGSNVDLAKISSPQSRLGQFDQFGVNNVTRYAEYLRDPAGSSPYANDDELSTRGSIWSFLRYAADRRGGSQAQLWTTLVNTSLKGMKNLQSALGTDPVAWVRDWSVSVYTDDAVPGVPAVYTQPSWNFRDLFRSPVLGGSFPLNVRQLAGGATQLATIKSGSAAYFRFGVAASQTADVRVGAGTSTVTGACTTVALGVGQVFQASGAAGSAVCLAGGAAGAEYVVIPFHYSPVMDATATVSVTASNVVPAVGAPTPSKSPAAAPSLSLFPLDRQSLWSRVNDGGFELALRTRERRELQHRILRGPGGGHGAALAVAADPAPATVTITYVRTK